MVFFYEPKGISPLLEHRREYAFLAYREDAKNKGRRIQTAHAAQFWFLFVQLYLHGKLCEGEPEFLDRLITTSLGQYKDFSCPHICVYLFIFMSTILPEISGAMLSCWELRPLFQLCRRLLGRLWIPLHNPSHAALFVQEVVHVFTFLHQALLFTWPKESLVLEGKWPLTSMLFAVLLSAMCEVSEGPEHNL